MLKKKHSSVITLALWVALAAASTPSSATLISNLLLAQAPNAAAPFPMPAAVPKNTVVRIDGSRTMTRINQSLKQRFEGQFAGTQIAAKEQGTEAGLKALLEGKVDLAAVGRSLSPEEKAKGLVEVPVVREKIALLISPSNPFKGSITVTQFAKIFRGEITDWSQLGGPAGKIRLIDRPETNSTRQAFRNYPVFSQAKFATGANAKQVADNTDEVIKALGRDGLGYAIANQVLNRKDVRIIMMHKTLPDNPKYPFSQSLSYAYKGTASPAVRAFLGFATAAPGQQAIAQARAAEAAASTKPSTGAQATPGTKPGTSPQTGTSSTPGEKPGTGGATPDAKTGAAASPKPGTGASSNAQGSPKTSASPSTNAGAGPNANASPGNTSAPGGQPTSSDNPDQAGDDNEQGEWWSRLWALPLLGVLGFGLWKLLQGRAEPEEETPEESAVNPPELDASPNSNGSAGVASLPEESLSSEPAISTAPPPEGFAPIDPASEAPASPNLPSGAPIAETGSGLGANLGGFVPLGGAALAAGAGAAAWSTLSDKQDSEATPPDAVAPDTAQIDMDSLNDLGDLSEMDLDLTDGWEIDIPSEASATNDFVAGASPEAIAPETSLDLTDGWEIDIPSETSETTNFVAAPSPEAIAPETSLDLTDGWEIDVPSDSSTANDFAAEVSPESALPEMDLDLAGWDVETTSETSATTDFVVGTTPELDSSELDLDLMGGWDSDATSEAPAIDDSLVESLSEPALPEMDFDLAADSPTSEDVFLSEMDFGTAVDSASEVSEDAVSEDALTDEFFSTETLEPSVSEPEFDLPEAWASSDAPPPSDDWMTDETFSEITLESPPADTDFDLSADISASEVDLDFATEEADLFGETALSGETLLAAEELSFEPSDLADALTESAADPQPEAALAESEDLSNLFAERETAEASDFSLEDLTLPSEAIAPEAFSLDNLDLPTDEASNLFGDLPSSVSPDLDPELTSGTSEALDLDLTEDFFTTSPSLSDEPVDFAATLMEPGANAQTEATLVESEDLNLFADLATEDSPDLSLDFALEDAAPVSEPIAPDDLALDARDLTEEESVDLFDDLLSSDFADLGKELTSATSDASATSDTSATSDALDLELTEDLFSTAPDSSTAATSDFSEFGKTDSSTEFDLFGDLDLSGETAVVGSDAEFDTNASMFDFGSTELASASPVMVQGALARLSEEYETNQIALTPGDAQSAHVHWEVPDAHQAALRQQGGQRLMVRLYDVTDIDASHQAPHSCQQYECSELTQDLSISVPMGDRDYLTEVGYTTSDGRWLPLARSHSARIPSASDSDPFNLFDQFSE